MSFWARLAAWLNPPDPGPVVFEPAWQGILEANIPLYGRLPVERREALHERITAFVRDKHFEGCNGLELNDEIVLTIAGQACVLTLGHAGDPFPKLRTVLVYPTAYRAVSEESRGAGVVMRRETVRFGESWANGTVILAWDAVLRDAGNCFDGHNVTFHEFAHQLDQADGRSDGTPPLPTPQRYGRWTTVLGAGHADLERMAAKGKRTVLDTYGATNPAEFFAVATEAFFEKPRQLQRKQPELYAELQAYYGLDPTAWFTRG